jgi:cysteine synthase A
MRISASVLDAIGNTPLVELKSVVPPGCARVVVKVEGSNPTGSMKDRMAQAMIARAEEDGRIRPDSTIVEYSGGSTGASLALVCAARGYKLRILSSDAFSEEKLVLMAALGADVRVIPSGDGLTTKGLINQMIAAAEEASRQAGCYWTDQLNNTDSVSGYHSLGEEIWQQSGGKIDAFVQSVGTAASLIGTTSVLRQHNPSLNVGAVEPAESAVLSGGKPGAHKIEGIGIGRHPPLWRFATVDEVFAVSTVDADSMALRLAREEGLFAGTSSGANVIAAIQIARRLGPGKTVATLLVDTGLRYLQSYGTQIKSAGKLKWL